MKSRTLTPLSGIAFFALVVGGVTVAGFLAGAWSAVTVADAADKHLGTGAIVTLNALSNDSFATFALPIGIMLLGAAGATLGRQVLPAWLGWLALVLGIAAFAPVDAAFFAHMRSGVWIV